MKTKILFVAGMALAASSAFAQETYENANLVENELNGTARYVGMGGAMEALGADISTISTNPAGIGLFRKNQVSMSAGVMAQTDAEKFTRYNNQTINFNGEKSHVTFDQVGIVWSPTRGRSSYLNLAFNYHKSADFGQILNAANSLKNVSQNKLTAAKNYKEYAGWTAVDANYGGYNNNQGNYQSGLFNVSTTGRLVYAEAQDFLFGQYQHGYIGTYDFNISGSLSNRAKHDYSSYH